MGKSCSREESVAAGAAVRGRWGRQRRRNGSCLNLGWWNRGWWNLSRGNLRAKRNADGPGDGLERRLLLHWAQRFKGVSRRQNRPVFVNGGGFVEAGAKTYPKNAKALLLSSPQQRRQLLVGHEFGGQKVVAHQQQGHLGAGEGLLDLNLPLRPRWNLGVVPQPQGFAAHQRPNHRLQPLHPLPINVAVADEQLIAFGGWGHRIPPGGGRSGAAVFRWRG